MHQFKYWIILSSIILIRCKEVKAPQEAEEIIQKKELFLPDEFEAIVVSEGVGPARHLAVNENGDIYVKLSKQSGYQGNMALRDTNQDGRADIIQAFGDYPDDGKFGTEMRINEGYLYFSSELVVYRQKLTPGKLIPESEVEIVLRDPYPIRWHNSKVLAFDQEGSMYVTFSAPTNACEDWNSVPPNTTMGVQGQYPCEQLGHLAGIWKFDKNKLNQSQSDGQKYASGLRSIVGMSWNEWDNSLYAVNHGRDYLHSHSPQNFSQWENAVLPAEEFMNIKEGEDYGWPYTYYDHFQKKRMMAPEYEGDGKKEAKGYADPIMGFPAHWAPNDLLFYKGDQFPPRYRKGAFVAFHGSTNRGPYPQAGYIVAFVPLVDGKFSDNWEVFLDGFAGAETVVRLSDAKYRPMGLSEGPEGSLYVIESTKGKIWRVNFQGDKDTFGEEQLKEMEERKHSKSYIKTPDPPQQ